MDSGHKASLCHGEHIRVRGMSCRLFEGFTFVRRIDRKGGLRLPNRAPAIKKSQRPARDRCCDGATRGLNALDRIDAHLGPIPIRHFRTPPVPRMTARGQSLRIQFCLDRGNDGTDRYLRRAVETLGAHRARSVRRRGCADPPRRARRATGPGKAAAQAIARHYRDAYSCTCQKARYSRCRCSQADRRRSPIVALVVDAAMVVAWFVIGQATTHTRKVLARAASDVLHAPSLLQIELASALVKLAHRRKIAPSAIGVILTEFEALEIVTDRAPPTARTIA